MQYKPRQISFRNEKEKALFDENNFMQKSAIEFQRRQKLSERDLLSQIAEQLLTENKI